MDTKKESDNWWKRMISFLKTHTSLTIIVVAALLMELTTGVMYYTAHNIIMGTTELLVARELESISLSIQKQLSKVEVTLDNMAWVETDDLHEPDSLFSATYQVVEHNPDIFGCSISCIPYLYPKRGYWFEAYAVRRPDGTIESMQLGSASHDYTKSEFFTEPIARKTGYWCEPYMDSKGAKSTIISYGVPIRNEAGKIVAVINADISLDWLHHLINKDDPFKLSQHFLVTGKYNLMVGKDSLLSKIVIEQVKADNKDGYFTLEVDNKLKHVFYIDVKGKTDWKVIIMVDDNEVFGVLRQVRIFLILLILAGFLLSCIIVWRTSCNLKRLKMINEEKERISSELRVASKIQQSMLPPHHLKQDEVEIDGSLVQAREVGGDLFDYFIRDEKLYFCIGDVSGKSTPAAMLMASTRSMFRAFSARKNDPAHIMEDINEAACQGNESCMFVTMFIGVLDLPTGHLRYCNAGHDAPFVMADSQWSMLDIESNTPVGLFEDFSYTVQETWLKPNSTIFLYTDGLTEAMDSELNQFQLERIEKVLEKCVDKLPKELLDTVSKAVHDFVGDAEQSDDLTMLAIRYTSQQFNSILSETLTLKNDIREVTKLSTFMKALFEKMDLENSLSRKLRLAVEEAVVNVINYAYPPDTEGSVELRMMSDGHQLKVMIIDAGVPFDPTTREKADVSSAIEERQAGGLGIHLMRELMDVINYERIDGQNILTLIKRKIK